MQGINSRRTLNGEVVMEDEIITTDVPETSEEELEEVDISTSENVETEPTQERDIEAEIEERANKLFEEKVEERLIRDRRARESREKEELRKYKYLEDIVKAGTGTNNLDEAIKETADFYKGNGLDIPEYSSNSEEDERILGQARANKFIDLGYEDMEEEANRIANIPRDQRTVREAEEFNILCAELTRRNNIKELKAKGYDSDVLETNEFKEFSSQFNDKVDISKVYEIYNKLNGNKVEKPYSPGSAKSTAQVKQIKEYYSPDDFDKLTDEDLNNPKIMEIVDKSRLQWFKK
jgi:hypothetical protein